MLLKHSLALKFVGSDADPYQNLYRFFSRQTFVRHGSDPNLIRFWYGSSEDRPDVHQDICQTFIRYLSDFSSESDTNLTRHIWHQKCDSHFRSDISSDSCPILIRSCQNLVGILSDSSQNLMKCRTQIWRIFFKKILIGSCFRFSVIFPTPLFS